MNQKGEFGQYILDQKMMAIGNLEKGPGFYLCCHNYGCYDNTVGKGERQLQVVTGEYHERTPLCATCTGMVNGE